MALGEYDISTTVVRNAISESTNNVSELVLSENVNRWGFNSPDAVQQAKYFAVLPAYLVAPHELGAFRRYDHLFRAYTWDEISKYLVGNNVGINLSTQIINEAISTDPGTISDFVLHCAFKYKNRYDQWVDGSTVSNNINKVGNNNFALDVFYLGNYGSTEVLMTIFWYSGPDRRWAPDHTTWTIINQSSEFEYYDWDSELHGPIIRLVYDKFVGQLVIVEPSGAYIDGNGFVDMSTYMDMSSGVDFEIWGFRIYNLSKEAALVSFKVTFNSSIYLDGSDEFTLFQDGSDYSIERAWELPGEYTVIGSSSNPVVFSNVGNPRSWTYGQTIYGVLEIATCDPSGLVEVSFVPFIISNWYYT